MSTYLLIEFLSYDDDGDVLRTLRTIYQHAASLGVGKNECFNS